MTADLIVIKMTKKEKRNNIAKALLNSVGAGVLALGLSGGLSLVLKQIGAVMFLTAFIIISGCVFGYLFLRDKPDFLGEVEDKINE